MAALTTEYQSPAPQSSSMRWFRFHVEALDDPKVQSLPGDLFKTWVNLLCVAAKRGGRLPVIGELAYLLRRRSDYLQKDLDDLASRGLLDVSETSLVPHNWLNRQYKSDSSTERTRRYRARRGNVTDTVTVTPPEYRVQNTEKENKKDSARSGRYEFESGVIKLTKAALQKWETAFPHCNVRAELLGMEQWLQQQPNWFMAAQGLLAKREREVLARKHGAPLELVSPNEPPVVTQGRRDGLHVEKLRQPNRWKVGTEVFNERGECVGA